MIYKKENNEPYQIVCAYCWKMYESGRRQMFETESGFLVMKLPCVCHGQHCSVCNKHMSGSRRQFWEGQLMTIFRFSLLRFIRTIYTISYYFNIYIGRSKEQKETFASNKKYSQNGCVHFIPPMIFSSLSPHVLPIIR